MSGVRWAVASALQVGCVTKVFAGEEHENDDYATLGLEALEGLLDTDPPPFDFYVEAGYPASQAAEERDVEAFLADRDRRQEVIDWSLRMRFPSVPPAIAAAFGAAASHESVTMRLTNFMNPNSGAPTAISNSTDALFAMLGYSHFLDTYAKPNFASVSYFAALRGDNLKARPGRLLVPLHETYLVPPQTHESQRAMLGMFERSQAHAPTMFVGDKSMFARNHLASYPLGPNGERLSPDKMFERFVLHYNSRNFAVMEVPYGDGLTGIVLLPAGCASRMKEIAAAIPGSVLHCKGLPHCAGTAAPARGHEGL